jgi:hypothetical protein
MYTHYNHCYRATAHLQLNILLLLLLLLLFRSLLPQWSQACVEMLTYIVVTTGILQILLTTIRPRGNYCEYDDGTEV